MIITTDGSYVLRDKKRSNTHSRTAVYISGEFGGATAFLAYHNSSQEAIPLLNGALTSGEQYLVHDGVQKSISIVVTGSTGTTAIDIETHGVV